ncbi:LysR family transcriptional regulator [Streptomyces sp. SPB074]|uniref:LysR family transcriptional regulator n=1 Tax=Streptomyces sp. (strain SPB074) TaxID=465543 RepID=UPI00017F1CE4|nr:LysR substrate-binding domain-containing protein [Streptomyces sp. SPB074]EDY43765.1 LysR family transcriptional regulator [Streptomyces sp. SPB074]
MLNPHQLRLLRELSRRGTIAAVAKALAYSPSAVSQQLSLLERATGTALFAREGRRIALTPTGARLVEHAEVILAHLEAAEAELSAHRGTEAPLRAGFSPSAARALAAPVFAALRASRPGLALWVREIDPADAGHAVRSGGLDVALVHTYEGFAHPPEPGLATEHLFSEPMLFAAREDGEGAGGGTGTVGPDARGREPGSLGDPVREHAAAPWILPAEDTLCHAVVTGLGAAHGVRIESWHRVDDYDTTLRLVAVGAGVAVVPASATAAPPPGVRLTPLPLARHSHLATRAGATAHPSARAFAAALRAVREGAGAR